MDIEELTGSGDQDETGRHAYPAASLIEQAMMGYGRSGPVDGGDEPGRDEGLDFLHAQASSAYQAYQATRYDATGRILPGLIRGVETVARTTGTASPAACAVRARVYDIAGCGCLAEDLVEVPLQELPTGPVDPVLRHVDDLTLLGVEPDEKTAPHPW